MKQRRKIEKMSHFKHRKCCHCLSMENNDKMLRTRDGEFAVVFYLKDFEMAD